MGNKIQGLLALSLLASSGAVLAKEVSLNKMSNQRVLEDTVSTLSISSILSDVVSKGSSVAIRNIETEETTDQKIVALIEDQIIIDLVNNGYSVLERDSNAIRRVIEEGGRQNFSIIRGDMAYLDQEHHVSHDGKFLPASRQVEDNKKNLLMTHLKPADYLLSYRVQELGVNYEDLDTLSVKRNSAVRLHVRIQDANTGKILFADNIERVISDAIPMSKVSTLANYRYSQFYQSYPGQNPDENNKYMVSSKNPYIQVGVLNSFDDQAGEFSVKSLMQVGIVIGKERIGIEIFEGIVEEKGAQMDQAGSFLIYAREIGTLNVGSIKMAMVPELGVGNASLTNWDDKKGAVEKTGLGFKAGFALETQVYNQFDVRMGLDVYAVSGGNFLGLGSLSVRYNF